MAQTQQVRQFMSGGTRGLPEDRKSVGLFRLIGVIKRIGVCAKIDVSGILVLQILPEFSL